MPDKVKELLDDLRQWRKEVGAQMPTLNPDYDPDRVHESMFYHEWAGRQPSGNEP